MSRRVRINYGRVRKDAFEALERHQKNSNENRELYWAKVDTLCQLLPSVPKENRWEALRGAWRQWMNGEAPEALLNYYTEWMVCFYVNGLPVNMDYLFIQAGSLMAKLEWANSFGSGRNREQMFRLCMTRLEALPRYENLDEARQDRCKRDLAEILSRYTDENGNCSRESCLFFLSNADCYKQTLQGLLDQLNEVKTEQEAGNAAQQKALQKEIVVSEDVMAGLCAFLEKTNSSLYQRALSSLYSLYSNPDQPCFEKKTKIALQSFFSALRALDIEPVDEQVYRTQYPEIYEEELVRQQKEPNNRYKMGACGWSCGGYLIMEPFYYRIKQEGTDTE